MDPKLIRMMDRIDRVYPPEDHHLFDTSYGILTDAKGKAVATFDSDSEAITACHLLNAWPLIRKELKRND